MPALSWHSANATRVERGPASYSPIVLRWTLLATALLIFAIGLYELFVEDIEMPEWLEVHSLHDLKAKLASVIVLVLGVSFLAHLAEWKDARETLEFGLAVAVVAAALIAFGHFGEKD